MVLTTAKAAFNDLSYDVAAERFREYIRLGAGTKLDLAAARYGLGVCLIEGTAKDYKAAAEMLQVPAGMAGFKDRAYALYYLGVAYRDQGAPVPLRKRQTQPGLEAAATQFGLAAETFAQLAPATVADGKDLPTEWEWVAKARCDQADALLRNGQYKQAAAAASAMLNDAKLQRSGYRPQAAYELGYASFGLKDYATAVRSLSTLAPFDQGEIGLHAQYLLARTHHLAGERPEAATGYQGLVATWQGRLREARVKLADPALGSGERARLEALLKAPAPDYVARGMFYWGVVLSEFGTPDEAMAKFLAAVQLSPNSPVAVEARIRAAQTAVQVRKFREASDAVAPLQDDPQYGVEALRYLAKAQYGAGTVPVAKGKGVAAQMNAVADPAALAAGIKQAIATLQKADERAKAMPASGAQISSQRGTILLELGDMLQLDRRYVEAAGAYAAAATAAGAHIVEPAVERQAIALQLAGDFPEADKVCNAFLSKYPKSDLRAEVSVRYAENALLAAHAKNDPAAANTDSSRRPYGEAVARFTRVIEQFPDTPQANLARMGLATVQYLQGHFTEAAGLLAKIPESDRVDDLVGVAFLLADCQLRTLPDSAEDALSSARMVAQLEAITTQLEGFVGSQPNDPQAADALVRIGYASVKLANLLADPVEKRRTLAKARRAYGQVIQQFSDHPLYPVALLENAKILASINGAPAVLELSKFQVPPLDKTAIAPLALIHLADAQRTRRRPEEAIRLLTELRGQREEELLKDPQRADWVPALQYSLALSYKESGKYEQARELFQNIAKNFPKRPEGTEALWRIQQCQTDPALAELEGLRRALAAANKPDTQQDLLAKLADSAKKLRGAAEQMGQQAQAIAAKGDETDLPQKMNFDAAWCWKSIGEVEVEIARRSMQAEAARKLAERLAQENPVQPPKAIRPAEIALKDIPMQRGEKLAREKFTAVIDAAGDSPLVDEARLELAEIYSQRDEADAAITLLKDAIAKDPTADLAERLKIRLGTLYLARGDAKAAAAVAAEVLATQRNAYASYARVLATEAAYQQKDWAGTIEQAKPFLDMPRGAGRIPGVSDHALLRMADAQGQLGQWKEAKQTLDVWFTRFAGSAVTYDAKFAYGWINENLQDPSKAIAAYTEVATRNAGELGAKANLQVGRLRLRQNQPAEALGPLLTVAYAYDNADLSPAAMCEAATALVQLKKPADAKRLLERALKDYPSSQWAAAARKQLGEIQ
jgi:tetratricopeptide (TPR) repeat protein/outer membrane protein assembly factor BamD (BamD/ComL family)